MTTFSEVTITNSLTLQNGVGLQIQGGNINAAGAQNLPVDPIGNPSPTTLVSRGLGRALFLSAPVLTQSREVLLTASVELESPYLRSAISRL